jgi:alpha-L-fucosidase
MELHRRAFLKSAGAATAAVAAAQTQPASSGLDEHAPGKQRLSLQQLSKWEALGFGMFIHFGMSTFDGEELSKGDKPSTFYAPDKLDVSQWIKVARDAGMKYAVLTTKHVAGHCLWPTKYTEYNVTTSGNKTDVVGAFVDACSRYGVMSGFYYCSWDNHNRFGSVTPSDLMANKHLPSHGMIDVRAYTTAEYRDFQTKQIEELLTTYRGAGEVWIDIPGVLPMDYRQKLYHRIAELAPQAVVMMNHGISDGSEFKVDYAWPTDLIAIERFLPNSAHGYELWRELWGDWYYMPGEVCDPIGRQWFYVDDDRPRSDAELLGMYLVCRSRGANLLLDVPPDRHGLIPKRFTDALGRLRKNLDKVGLV